MNRFHQSPSGIALPVLLLFVALGTGLTLSLGARTRTALSDHASRSQAALSAAREALIGRAVSDDNRPGSLPCPDLLTDNAGLANYPGDGKADLHARNQCPSIVGRLPWSTLATPVLRDNTGEVLWYIAAPGLRDDDSASPINSDTPTGLSLDGQADIAALLITAGRPLPGQSRPSPLAADYLEGLLDGANPFNYRPHPQQPEAIVTLTQKQLFATVELRVIHSVRRCLSAHARQSGSYPWPAPLPSPDRQGSEGARFGRLPLTQPSTGTARRLRATAEALGTHAGNLRLTDAAGRPDALLALADGIAWTAKLLNQLGRISADIDSLANAVTAQLNTLQTRIGAAVANERIARSEGESIRAGLASALLTVDRLDDAFLRYGLNFEQNGLPSRQRLRITQADLHQQAELFIRLDTADPRPVQRKLVEPAQALAAAAGNTAALAASIRHQAAELSARSLAQRQLAEFALHAISGPDGASATVEEWQRKPTADTRQRATQLINASLANADTLASGLGELSALTGDEPGTAWPMVWAARHCDFIDDVAGWWQSNRWADLTFYQAADPLDPSRQSLIVDGRPPLSLVVISAGPRLPHQHRPSDRIADYLEATNAHPTRDGPAHNPARLFVSPAGTVNDQLAY